MPSEKPVVWYEGMFMTPQHMQQQSRHVEGVTRALLNAATPLGWGFSELVLDRSQLASGSLGITRARGVFQDGTPFEIGSAGATPPALDVSDAESGALVYLCAARSGAGARGQEFSGRANGQLSVRYLAQTLEVADNAAEFAESEENDRVSPAPESVSITVGELRIHLLLDSADAQACLRLPIARVEGMLADGSVRLDDKTFIPPVTTIEASAVLTRYVRELSTIVRSRADKLARRVGDLVSGVEFSLNILWLMVANRFDPVLSNIASRQVHPAHLYETLLGLAGELSTLNTPGKRPAEFSPYDHLDLERCFTPLLDELRTIWSAEPIELATELPLVYHENRQTWLSNIENHSLLEQADFVLAATADVSEELLATRLPEQMVIAPAEEIQDRAPGVRLTLAKVKPRNVPTLNRWTYFYLNNTGKAWDALASSVAFAFFVDRLQQDFPGLQLKFWRVPHAL